MPGAGHPLPFLKWRLADITACARQDDDSMSALGVSCVSIKFFGDI